MAEAEDSKIFPQKLMEILNDPQNHEAICWLPHGKSFVVRNRKLFAETVMPRYFSRKAKYSSFTRKLNRWNFSRVSSGPEIGAYHHEYFRKDKPFLAATMFCKNARTMLAMASDPGSRGDMTSSAKEETLVARPTFEELNTTTLSQLDQEEESFREQILQQQNRLASSSLRRGSTGLMAGLGVHSSSLDTSSTSVRLLERQILLLQQQEETNRLLLEHAMMVQQQRELLLDEEQRKLSDDTLMSSFRRGVPSYNMGMQAPRKPTGNRASAA